MRTNAFSLTCTAAPTGPGGGVRAGIMAPVIVSRVP